MPCCGKIHTARQASLEPASIFNGWLTRHLTIVRLRPVLTSLHDATESLAIS